MVLARDRSSAPLGRDADARHWRGSNSAFSLGTLRWWRTMKAFATEVNELLGNALGPAIMAPLRPNRGSIHRASAMNHGLHQNLQLFSGFGNFGC